jgi:endonuclease/exonuclease/phosphatase family metal-dependent hydrolase
MDFARLAADAMGAGWHRFAPTVLGTPGAHWTPAAADDGDGGGPAYGIALLSRLPVTRSSVVPLPALPVRAPVMAPGMHRPILVRDEPRVGLIAEVSGLAVCATHLSFVPGWNARQLHRLRLALMASPGPRLIVGDLNLPLRAVTRVLRGWTPLVRGVTYPATRPRVQFDHVVADDRQLPVAFATVRRTAISDHRAVVVDLDV